MLAKIKGEWKILVKINYSLFFESAVKGLNLYFSYLLDKKISRIFGKFLRKRENIIDFLLVWYKFTLFFNQSSIQNNR